MYRLYEYPLSGNCYKLRLLLTQLGHPFESVRIDILNGENRSAEFLRINPAGKVPVLEIGDGNWLPESNAGLWYLDEEGIDLSPYPAIRSWLIRVGQQPRYVPVEALDPGWGIQETAEHRRYPGQVTAGAGIMDPNGRPVRIHARLPGRS